MWRNVPEEELPGYMYGIIIKDIGLFKQLTSGGSDVVTAEKKFGALGRPESRFIKFLFAGNHLPRLRETDDAFWSRMVLVPFENQIKQEERDPDLLDKLLKRSDECVKKLGIEQHGFKKIRFHDLRHSYATLLLHEGYTLQEIQVYLGHATFQTTLRYAYLDATSKISAANCMEAYLAMPKARKIRILDKKSPLVLLDQFILKRVLF